MLFPGSVRLMAISCRPCFLRYMTPRVINPVLNQSRMTRYLRMPTTITAVPYSSKCRDVFNLSFMHLSKRMESSAVSKPIVLESEIKSKIPSNNENEPQIESSPQLSSSSSPLSTSSPLPTSSTLSTSSSSSLSSSSSSTNTAINPTPITPSISPSTMSSSSPVKPPMVDTQSYSDKYHPKNPCICPTEMDSESKSAPIPPLKPPMPAIGVPKFKMPSRDQVEKYFFTALVYIWDFSYYVFCLTLRLIDTYILKNPTLQEHWKRLLKRLDEQRQAMKAKK